MADLEAIKKIFLEKKYKDYKDFASQAEKLGMPKKNATARFYLWKKNPPKLKLLEKASAKPAESAVLDATSPQEVADVVTVSPANVVVDTQPVLQEGQTLRDKYAKMYSEVQPIDSGEAPKDIDGGALPPGNIAGAPDAQKNFTVKIGELFYQLGVAVNNNILWTERQLKDDEKEYIKMASNDIETTFNPEDLKRDDAPYVNYLLAGLLVPTIGRIDLIPAKVNAVRDWFSNLSKGGANKDYIVKPSPDIAVHQKETPTESFNGINAAVWNNMTDTQREWATQLVDSGFKVSPNYQANGPSSILDYDAYREHKILRNKGDTWVPV